jgi:hypothetical protein
MGKYSSMQRRSSSKTQPDGLPPIWRGIGFGMMILIPGMAYVGMLVLIQYNQDHNLFPIPMDVINKTGDPLLFIKIGIVLVLMLVMYAILMLVTFILNKLFSPSQINPFDVPRVAYRRKKRL